MPMLLSIFAALGVAAQPVHNVAPPPAMQAERVAPRIVDLRPMFSLGQWRPGRNLVYQDRFLRVVVIARRGSIVSGEVRNLSGAPMTIANQHGEPVGGGCADCCVITVDIDVPVGSDIWVIPCSVLRFLNRLGIRTLRTL